MAVSKVWSAAAGAETFAVAGIIIGGEKPEVMSPYLGKTCRTDADNTRRRSIRVKAKNWLSDSKAGDLIHVD